MGGVSSIGHSLAARLRGSQRSVNGASKAETPAPESLPDQIPIDSGTARASSITKAANAEARAALSTMTDEELDAAIARGDFSEAVVEALFRAVIDDGDETRLSKLEKAFS